MTDPIYPCFDFTATVYMRECRDNSISMCDGVICTNTTQEVGCEHQVCTLTNKVRNKERNE